jgi:hypothetical protein
MHTDIAMRDAATNLANRIARNAENKRGLQKQADETGLPQISALYGVASQLLIVAATTIRNGSAAGTPEALDAALKKAADYQAEAEAIENEIIGILARNDGDAAPIAIH